MQRSPLPGAFAFAGPPARYMRLPDGNLFRKGNLPMAIPMERVEDRIQTIRGHREMVDTDLAEVYGVPTKRLNEQVKRNADRFPEDFAFRLTPEEKMELVAKCDRFSCLKHSSRWMEPPKIPRRRIGY